MASKRRFSDIIDESAVDAHDLMEIEDDEGYRVSIAAEQASNAAIAKNRKNQITDQEQAQIKELQSSFKSICQSSSLATNLALSVILKQCNHAQLLHIQNELTKLMKVDFITKLPTALATKVLSYLPVNFLLKTCSLVSKRWQSIVGDNDDLWTDICQKSAQIRQYRQGLQLPPKQLYLHWLRTSRNFENGIYSRSVVETRSPHITPHYRTKTMISDVLNDNADEAVVVFFDGLVQTWDLRSKSLKVSYSIDAPLHDGENVSCFTAKYLVVLLCDRKEIMIYDRATGGKVRQHHLVESGFADKVDMCLYGLSEDHVSFVVQTPSTLYLLRWNLHSGLFDKVRLPQMETGTTGLKNYRLFGVMMVQYRDAAYLIDIDGPKIIGIVPEKLMEAVDLVKGPDWWAIQDANGVRVFDLGVEAELTRCKIKRSTHKLQTGNASTVMLCSDTDFRAFNCYSGKQVFAIDFIEDKTCLFELSERYLVYQDVNDLIICDFTIGN